MKLFPKTIIIWTRYQAAYDFTHLRSNKPDALGFKKAKAFLISNINLQEFLEVLTREDSILKVIQKRPGIINQGIINPRMISQNLADWEDNKDGTFSRKDLEEYLFAPYFVDLDKE